MGVWRVTALLCGVLLLPSTVVAADATVDIPELVLNQLLAGMGIQSASGVYQPPGTAPVSSSIPWQWWVTDSRFALAQGAMSFTATVRSQINGQQSSDTRTVPASAVFDASTSRLRINMGTFKVPLQSGGVTIAQVDVAKLYGVTVPVVPQTFTLALPGGSTRVVTARVAALTTTIQPGRLVLNVTVGY